MKIGVDKSPKVCYNKGTKTKEDNTMKKELRYIRYRICRSIYYADQCPMDNRKNYRNICKNILCALGLCAVGLTALFVAVLLA